MKKCLSELVSSDLRPQAVWIYYQEAMPVGSSDQQQPNENVGESIISV